MMGICQHSLYVGLAATLVCMDGATASAGLMVTSVGSSIQLGFDSFQGDGFTSDPTSSQLDSDHWRVSGLSDGAGAFGGSFTAGDFARGASSGGVSTGGIYGFDVDSGAGTNWALGFQPIGSDLTPGAVTLMITNATGMWLDRLDLAYQVLVRNDADRSSSFQFAFSADDINYHWLGGLQVNSTAIADTNPQWVATHRTTSLAGLNLADGSSLFLQWALDDLSGSGGRDEWALDNIGLAFSAGASTVPEPSSWILLAMLCPALFWKRHRSVLAGDRPSELGEDEKVLRRKLQASVEVIPLASEGVAE